MREAGKLYSGGRRRPMKLLGSLRGTGALIWTGPPVEVVYQLDLYRAGDDRTAHGTIDGSLESLLAADLETATLQLADGLRVPIALTEMEADNADFDASGEGLDRVQLLLNAIH